MVEPNVGHADATQQLEIYSVCTSTMDSMVPRSPWQYGGDIEKNASSCKGNCLGRATSLGEKNHGKIQCS